MRISITLPFNLCSVLWEADLCRLHRRPRTSRSKSLHCSAPFPGLLFNSFPIVVLLWPPHFLSLSPLFQDCSLSLLSLVVRVLSVISPWHWHYASWLPAPLEIQPAPSPNGSVPLPLAMILAGTLGIPVQNPQGKIDPTLESQYARTLRAAGSLRASPKAGLPFLLLASILLVLVCQSLFLISFIRQYRYSPFFFSVIYHLYLPTANWGPELASVVLSGR